MSKKLYQRLASLISARLNCMKSGNAVWEANHTDDIHKLIRDRMPSGSGIDNGTKIDLDSCSDKKIVLVCDYHHMNDGGYYDGWTTHDVIITPCFDGIDIKITGSNRNDIKEYLGDTYHYALTCEE